MMIFKPVQKPLIIEFSNTPFIAACIVSNLQRAMHDI
jgi:hypothetical protein